MSRKAIRITLAGVTATAAAAGTLLATTANAAPVAPAASGARVEHSCAVAKPGFAACDAIRNDMKSTAVRAYAAMSPEKRRHAAVSGFGPSDIQSAYNIAGKTSSGTVAIVDANDDPTAEADLGVYRTQFGLPSCTAANGCFKKVDQNGGSSYPATDAGWATEISLDLDMVSATCPSCKILLVEANSANMSDLGAAVNTAASLGASSISNSYGGSEDSTNSASDSQYFHHPGIPITASTGDSGYGVQYPAASAYVTAVGGTSLTKDSSSRGWTETAWSGAGSGCSAYTAQISGQASANTGCSKRAVADVSAVADPNTGVAVYDSTPYQGFQGWQVYGGTSASSPIVASVYALAGNGVDNNYAYAHASSFNDVTSGSNGSCPTAQWCNAGAGWDGPTGLGTPNGLGGF